MTASRKPGYLQYNCVLGEILKAAFEGQAVSKVDKGVSRNAVDLKISRFAVRTHFAEIEIIKKC